MSARNTRKNKKLRSLQRALRKGRTPAYIDLIKWLRDRKYANTAGRAREIILAGKVKSESHTLGIKERIDRTGQKVPYVDPFVSVRLVEHITCDAPKVKPYYES